MSERDQIIAIFEAHRRTPGAPYIEENFLDYLLAQPKKKGAVYNSFSGLRRFNAFIDQVQLDYAICFSLKDREANYALDTFVARVGGLRDSRRSSLASLNNQMRAGFGWGVVALGDLVVCIAAIALRQNHGVLLLCLALLLSFNIFWLIFFIRHKRYTTRLHKELLQAAAMRPNNSFKGKPLRGSP